MLAQCAAWIPGPAKDYTNAGTERHSAFADYLTRGEVALADVDEDEADKVRWAAEYVTVHRRSDLPLIIEQKISLLDEVTFEVISEGTPDVVCGNDIFDLKARPRDYYYQFARYAQILWQTIDGDITVHLLFTETRHVNKFVLTKLAVGKYLTDLDARLANPNPVPAPCDYCGWCGRCATCPAMLERVNTIAAGREDWKLEQYHSSQIETADEMGKALRLAKALSKWCDAVDFQAKEMAVKRGIVATGFRIATRQGNRFVTSVTDAYTAMGLPQDLYLAACTLAFSGAVEAWKKFSNVSKAVAEKEVTRKLGELLQRKESTISLVEEKK
jgi:hypothetical protein